MRLAVRVGAAAIAAALVAGGALAQSRDRIQIVGSSTVYPFAQAVAEQFADATGFRAPLVEATGTGGGMKMFCAGLGPQYPDIVAASRPMKPSEHALCSANGVDDITEALLGYDGLTIAQSNDAPDMNLTKAQLFEALAAEVAVAGRVVDNPHSRWSEVAPALPDRPIQVFGPPPSSGTRDAFVSLVMMPGCADLPDPARQCGRMRQDGRFIEAGENDNRIIQHLEADPTALGIFGYASLYENRDRLKAVAVDGVLPDALTIADGSYPLARPLFLYVKNAHRTIIPGLVDFVGAFISDDNIGPGGDLIALGLIGLPDARRHEMRAAVRTATQFDRFN